MANTWQRALYQPVPEPDLGNNMLEGPDTPPVILGPPHISVFRFLNSICLIQTSSGFSLNGARADYGHSGDRR